MASTAAADDGRAKHWIESPSPRLSHVTGTCIGDEEETPQHMSPYSETHTAIASSHVGPGHSHHGLHVTSPMSPPAAYDPTRLAFASFRPPQARQQTTCAVPTLAVPQQPTATLLPVWPPPPLLAPTPQLALAHTGGLPTSIPRPSPREQHLQDDLYYAFTRDAYLCSGTAAARQLAATLKPDKTCCCCCCCRRAAGPAAAAVVPAAATATAIAVPKETVKKPHRRPQQPLKRPLHALSPQNQPPPKRPKPSTTATTTTTPTSHNDLHFVDSSLFATLNAAMMEIASRQLPTHQPMASASPKISFKDTTWNFPKKLKKKRPRPSEIFNINFGFGFSSRRRQSSDYSPQVSPRTSISSASGSPRSDMTESFKRQRIDSTGSDVDVTRSKSARLGEPDCIALSPSTTRCQGEEPHPGQLVDFTRTPPSLPSPPPPVPAPVMVLPSPKMSPRMSPKLAPQTNPASDAYHEYLATTQRRKSFPVSDWAARRVRDELQMFSKLDQPHAAITIEEEIDPLDTTSNNNDISAIAPFEHLPAQPLEQTKCELRRTTSDPSTERFLTHIRASLEARRSKSGRTWQTYPVFADEVEKGFLDDAPL